MQKTQGGMCLGKVGPGHVKFLKYLGEVIVDVCSECVR